MCFCSQNLRFTIMVILFYCHNHHGKSKSGSANTPLGVTPDLFLGEKSNDKRASDLISKMSLLFKALSMNFKILPKYSSPWLVT